MIAVATKDIKSALGAGGCGIRRRGSYGLTKRTCTKSFSTRFHDSGETRGVSVYDLIKHMLPDELLLTALGETPRNSICAKNILLLSDRDRNAMLDSQTSGHKAKSVHDSFHLARHAWFTKIQYLTNFGFRGDKPRVSSFLIFILPPKEYYNRSFSFDPFDGSLAGVMTLRTTLPDVVINNGPFWGEKMRRVTTAKGS